MIVLDRVGYEAGLTKKTQVLDDISCSLPTNARFVILGGAGSGKTSLVRILTGMLIPTSGAVTRFARISYPVGFSGGFRPKLSVRANIAYVARAYGSDPDEVMRFVVHVGDLPNMLDDKYGNLAQQEKVKLAFILSYAIHFDTYIVDNNIGTGDPHYRKKCEALLEARAKNGGYIIATRNHLIARRWGERIAILSEGRLRFFDERDEALEVFAEEMEAAASSAEESV